MINEVDLLVIDSKVVMRKLEEVISQIKEIELKMDNFQRANAREIPLLAEKEAVTLNEIMKLTGIARSTWWAGVKSGTFPQPIPSISRPKRWASSDIKKFLTTKE
ncbi:MAG: AlpA family phage regulatory protein [Synergistaceae bacterium]